MIDDIVIDTNILMHSHNPHEQRYDHCCSLLKSLLVCSTKLAVDEGFNLEKAKNRSFIGHEYLENISHGTLAYSVLSQLAGSKRIAFFDKRVSRREQRIIDQCIRKTIDKVFLGVAFNSREKILVSHDFEDFQQTKRDDLRNVLGVDIIEACESLDYL